MANQAWSALPSKAVLLPADIIAVLDTAAANANKRSTVRAIVNPAITSLTTSGTPAPNVDTTDLYVLTALTQTATFGTPTGTPVHGQRLEIQIYSAGAQTLDFTNSAYVALGVVLPTTTVAGKWTYLMLQYNLTATKWHVIGVAQEE